LKWRALPRVSALELSPLLAVVQILFSVCKMEILGKETGVYRGSASLLGVGRDNGIFLGDRLHAVWASL
jgi:hypothetical protein